MKLLREEYASDKAFWAAMVKGEVAWAKAERAGQPYESSRFPVRTTMIGPQWQCAHIPISWHDKEEKRFMMTKLAYLAQATSAKGVMISSDVRMLKVDDLKYHFKMPEYEASEEGNAKFQADYSAIIQRHGDSMQNLPRHLWSEAIHVGLKTPELGDMGESHPYTRGNGGRLMWLPKGPNIGRMEMTMLHDWWTIPEDDPNLVRAVQIAGAFLEATVNEVSRKRG